MPAAIGGSTFYDGNNNGIWNAPEAAAPGVQVSLLPFGGTPATATTDSAGHYSFPALSTGSYSVSFTAPSGYTVSNPVGGTAFIALDTSDATVDAALVGSGSGSGTGIGSGSGSGSGGGSGSGVTAMGSYTYGVPLNSIDPEASTQSVTLTNFVLIFGGQTFTTNDTFFSTTPTIDASYGTAGNVHFALTIPTPVNGYTSLSVDGGAATAVSATTGLAENVNVADANAALLVLDFSTVNVTTYGETWPVNVKYVGDANFRHIGSVELPSSGDGGSKTVWRDKIYDAMKAKGVDVTKDPDSDTRLIIKPTALIQPLAPCHLG